VISGIVNEVDEKAVSLFYLTVGFPDKNFSVWFFVVRVDFFCPKLDP
jgi:hypothetical protein